MTDEDQPRFSHDDLKKMGEKWLSRIKTAEKREDDWTKSATKAEAAYLCDSETDAGGYKPQFNILHANVETIVPAIYNSTPSPDIRPRHNVNDGPIKALSDAFERAIATQIDDDALDTQIEALAQDVEIAGRGVTRIKFDVAEDGMTAPRVIFENVSWRDYREGPAKNWAGVPWVAYRHSVSEDEYQRLEADDIAEVYAREKVTSDDDEELDVDIWEIWSKEDRRVFFVCEKDGKVLDVVDDPLGLTGFFPQPDAVVPIKGTGKRDPVAPFEVYQRLADELDTVTKRIHALTKGMKAKGLFAGDAEIAQQLADLDDNDLAPASDLQSLMAVGGLDAAVLWWPIDRIIQVLRELHIQRDRTIQNIYELTGISDIVRGSSDPNETAAAQKIKTQWGSQRIKRKQRQIQSHIRDLFKLTAEVIATKFTPQSFAVAAGIAPDDPAIQAFVAMAGRLDHLRIDVETDSTIRADLDKQRGEMGQFLEATGGFFGVMGPLVADRPQMAPAALEMFNAFARSFQLGKQAEDAIDQLSELARQDAQNPQPNPAQEAQKAEMAMKQQEGQIKMAEAQARMVEAQTRAASAQQKMQIDAQKARLDELRLRLDAAKVAQDYGLRVRQQDMAEMQAEIDALLRIDEAEIERTQMRPVQFG